MENDSKTLGVPTVKFPISAVDIEVIVPLGNNLFIKLNHILNLNSSLNVRRSSLGYVIISKICGFRPASLIAVLVSASVAPPCGNPQLGLGVGVDCMICFGHVSGDFGMFPAMRSRNPSRFRRFGLLHVFSDNASARADKLRFRSVMVLRVFV